ncbi:hypothetical protein AaE_000884 [Aphanomyces astaci]|uniref:MJ1316 RNA cyclic group end recognition domain-containing protein n=1 Tax=Aphanomyces astaci TaxID=112090 RepID=A0A6A5ADU0_APHAT|nr:hypothetical protein AaE_000884 [Aphanomyces astaci]
MQLLLRAAATAAATVAFLGCTDASISLGSNYLPHQSLRRLGATDVNNATLDSAKKFSQDALKFLTNLRGGDEVFYQHLITTMQIIMCDQSVNSDGHAEAAEANAVWTGTDDLILPYHRFVIVAP